ncbi:PadR family transcriptional regulator [Gorillibacterium massiliense]|uniref:PadR family transcriptional regulator n=1 Tax=Gorillibacterium massiliense TaxID=1280390 RepID=UPI0004AE22B4|nr:PadR family transcriptional regulator [Gorillibacterium massiliense]
MKGKDVILGLLQQKSRTGYEINDYFKSVFSHFFNGTYGMIYPTLKKLEQDKVIQKEVIVQEGKPNRNVFSISDEGRKLFDDYLESPVQPEVVQSDFLMRLFFGEFVEESVVEGWIAEELERKKQSLEQLLQITWKDQMTPTQMLSYDIGVAQYEAHIRVMENKLADLKRQKEQMANEENSE